MTPVPAIERFIEKIDLTGPEDACWEWKAGTTEGYGKFWDGRSAARAHRFAFELLVGPVPEGLQLDHLCRNRACVNPAHLEPVTGQVNVLRGEGISATYARRTHCKHGHELTPENTYTATDARRCKTYKQRLIRERRRRIKLAAVEGGDR